MKKEYYIQGDPAKAEQIKAAFERLGIDTTAINVGDEDFLYFSSNGLLYFEEFSNTLLNIFKTHPGYTELQLPVKPKFNVGDWIANDYCDGKVIALTDDAYLLDSGQGIPFSCEHNAHLWTIEDAKNGDVLVASDKSLFIFARTKDNAAYYHYSLCKNGSQEISDGKHAWEVAKYCHPATKEQRDLLFAKMREAGYEWDENKKELRRIIKPKFKVGDWLWHKEKGVFPMMVEDYDEKEGYLMQFTDEAKCYFGRDIIENDYRLWEISDAKEGDVLAVDWNEKNGHVKNKWEKIVIFKSISEVGVEGYGCTFRNNKLAFDTDVPYYSTTWTRTLKPATKEQRDLLFAKMRKAGYEWDADKKELKKQKHYDISSFHEGMPVLVRDGDCGEWRYVSFSHYRKVGTPFSAGGQFWFQCIPYNEKTKHLLGTTDMCDEQYINW